MIEDNPADEILTPEEVAVILGATQKTPLQMHCAQDGPADLKICPGPKGHVRYRRVDVDAFIALERKPDGLLMPRDEAAVAMGVSVQLLDRRGGDREFPESMVI